MLDHSIMLAKLKELELKNVIPTGKVLGKGSFGKVIEVLWSNSTCAAKEFTTSSVGELIMKEGNSIRLLKISNGNAGLGLP